MVLLSALCPWHKMATRNLAGKTTKTTKTFQISVLLVLIFLNLFQVTWTQNLKFRSVEALKTSQDKKVSDSEPLSLLWGIADTTAYVGKLFKYTLPNDAFQGNVVNYHVSI